MLLRVQILKEQLGFGPGGVGEGWGRRGVRRLEARPRLSSPPPAAGAESPGPGPRGRGGSHCRRELALGWFRVERLRSDRSSGRRTGRGKGPRREGSWGRDRAAELARTPPLLCHAQPRLCSAWLPPSPEFPIPSFSPSPLCTHPGISALLKPPPPFWILFSQHPSLHTVPFSRTSLPGAPSHRHQGPLPPAPIASSHPLPRDHLPGLASRLVSTQHLFLAPPLPSRTAPLPSVAPTPASPRLLPAPIPRCGPRQHLARAAAPLHLRAPSPPPPAPWRAASRTSCCAPSV